MQKTKAISAGVLLFLAVAASASAQTPAPSSAAIRKDNIGTVDKLMKLENIKALDLASKSAQALGLEASPTDATTSKKGAYTPPPASLYVDSISGVGEELRADVSYNGMRFERVRMGAQIGPCKVKSVLNRRVTLGLADKKSGANQCPSADWTGGPNPADLVPVGADVAARPQARPLPAGLPLGAPANSMQTPGAALAVAR